MANGIKLLVAAYENSRKSTLAAQIEDALVINFDRKEYAFKVPHKNITHYEGLQALTESIMTVVEQYSERYDKLPKTIVLDTVTQFQSSLQKYSLDKFKGFDIHSNNNKETLGFNDFIENDLIANGVNVVIVAHTNYDEATARHVIPSSGAFAKAGSFLSIVNDGIFLEKKSNKVIVHHKSLKLPCRTTLEDIPESQDYDEYNINDHIQALTNRKLEAVAFKFD